MQVKTSNRIVCAVLSLLMLLMSVSFTGLSMTASAEDTTYVLEASALTAAGEGSFTDGQTLTAGTDGFFTLLCGAKTKIDSSSKTFDDGYASGQRINFGYAASTSMGAVQFTTTGAAQVKVWFAEAGDNNRQMTVLDASGNAVATTSGTYTKNDPYIVTLEIPSAGTYFLGGDIGNNYIFKVEVSALTSSVYEFNSADLALAEAGTFTDGQAVSAGTDDYFTIYYSAKSKVDTSGAKTWIDGYEVADKGTRLSLGGTADASTPMNVIAFKTSGAANIKVWWVEGGDTGARQMVIYDSNGNEVAKSNDTTVEKNATSLAVLQVESAGTYFLGGDTGNNYIFRVQVTEGGGVVIRSDWNLVSKPNISRVILSESKDSFEITADAVVGADGGDVVVISMYDEDGNVVESKQSIAEAEQHTVTFTPTASGVYSFGAVLSREGCSDKASAKTSMPFSLPLTQPAISSATSKGNGTVQLVYSPVTEADSYNIYCDGELAGTSTSTSYTVSGLTVGQKYSFTVAAVRDSEMGPVSAAIEATATEEAQQTWGWVRFGTSTDDKNNGYVGSVNEDGQVTVYSENGKGKVQGSSNDGISFYYTPVPTSENFTLRTLVHVDSWTYSNGQEGVGMVALDSIPEVNSANVFWTNSYMAAATLISYNYDSTQTDNIYGGVVYDGTGSKYSMYIGLGVDTKLGLTAENIDDAYVSSTGIVEYGQYPLDISLGQNGEDAGSYNMIGNVTNAEKLRGPSYTELTDFVLEIQKNNTGYFLSYYTTDGTLVRTQKFYDTEALSQLDKDYVYVGFFAARNMRATFSDIQFTTIDPADDAPAEERPVEKVQASVTVSSADFANSSDYNVLATPNVDGTADVYVNGVKAAEGVAMTADTLSIIPVTIVDGDNAVSIVFTPDADQDLGEGKALANADAVTTEFSVNFDNYFAEQTNLYVSPNAGSTGNGTKEYPLSIYEAVKVAQPGQKIILMEGTYYMTSGLVIERGIDGTADDYIYMMADPEASTRPVIDMQKQVNGIYAAGDYWYFQGFDVTNSVNKNGGFHLCGSNCVLDGINAYDNGDSGIYIHAYHNSTDPRELWPHDNLILNCTSYNNSDSGYEDADGFACKLTTGDGNVFDGCVSYNNADDGWDLYARASSGNIGAVTIMNCVAYNNGYLLDGTNAGNGNGFKMGGESLAGGHTIINCVAFNNKAKGIDCNSCPDINIINCTSYNNEGYNVALYTSNSSISTDFSSTGAISFKDSSIKSGLTEADNFAPQGTQDTTKYGGDTNYVWNGSSSTNASGVQVTADWFVSLEFKGVVRNADGTIDLQGFLELTDAAPADAGARLSGGTASEQITVTEDENVASPRTGIELTVVILIVLMAAIVAVLIVNKRRKA